jgi:protein NrfD
MDRIHEIIFLVLGSLSVGGTFLLPAPSLTTAGLSFYRVNGAVFWITALLGLFLGAPPTDGLPFIFFFCFVVVLFFYNLRLWFRHPHSSNLLLFVSAAVGMAGFFIALADFVSPANMPIRYAFFSLHTLLQSLLLGAGTLAMLLGHTYLTQPTLSIVPLMFFSRIFMGLVFAEGGFVITNLIFAAQSEQVQNAILLNSFEGLYLWIRVLTGILGPMILAPMIIKTVQERATMSATGLLYIAMLMVIIGALFSRFFLLVDARLI